MARYWAMILALATAIFGQWQPIQQLTNGPGLRRLASNARPIAVAGEVVHIVWVEGGGEICYVRSNDGGVVWDEKTVLSSGTQNATPGVAVTGSCVHVVWATYAGEEGGIYYRRSTDGGVNWEETKLLFSSSDTLYAPALAVSGDSVHVVWQNSLPGGAEVMYCRSSDRGISWSSPVSISERGAYFPVIEAAGNQVHVFWIGENDGRYAVIYNRSEDGGESWKGSVQLALACGWELSVAVLDSTVHFVWCDGASFDSSEVYWMRSNDGGKNWEARVRLTNPGGYSGRPAIAVAGERIHVVWEGTRSSSDTNVYYKRSPDAGQTWSAEYQLTTAAGCHTPSVAATASDVHVVFVGLVSRFDEQMYYRRYGRRGASIAGTVYDDENGSGSRQPVERGLSGWTVRLDPGPRYVLTDESGNYFFHSLPPGQYAISEVLKNNWRITYPSAPGVHIVNVGSREFVTGKDFGNKRVGTVQDLKVSIAGGPARPGSERSYSIFYENAGTLPVEAMVKVTLPVDVTYKSSGPSGIYDPLTHSITWSLSTLPPGSTGVLSLVGQVAVVPVGTELTTVVIIEPRAGDITPQDNSDTEIQLVQASYESNMILVRPSPYVQQDDTLDCTIYFQNVGSDTAFDLIVRQIPDPNLDQASFCPLASSHKYAFGLGENGEWVWTFSNIRLADSGANAQASRGFLRYKIVTRADLEPGTIINNRAAMYFDHNPPVLTNNVALTVTMQGKGWTEVKSMPVGPNGSVSGDGAWLAVGPDVAVLSDSVLRRPHVTIPKFSGSVIYVAKGNKTTEFFKYYPVGDSWKTLSPIPDTEPSLGKPKPVSKGSCAVSDGKRFLYVLRGNNTPGFWRYDVGSGTWDTLPRAPQKIKGGNDLAYVNYAGKEFLYLLGGGKNAFYRYDVETQKWSILDSAPAGNNKRKYGKGSFLVYDEDSRLYVHQAGIVSSDSHHFMFRYDLKGDSWYSSALKGMPWLGAEAGRENKKKKSKDGACGAWYNGYLYALKGGGSQGFYRFDPTAEGSWIALETIPTYGSGGIKAVKAGGDLVSYGLGAFYALKGNKTRELWRYVESQYHAPNFWFLSARRSVGQREELPRMALRITPSPVTNRFAIVCVVGLGHSKARAAHADCGTLRVFDAVGRSLLMRSVDKIDCVSGIPLDLRGIPAGVYLVRLDLAGASVATKLVVPDK